MFDNNIYDLWGNQFISSPSLNLEHQLTHESAQAYKFATYICRDRHLQRTFPTEANLETKKILRTVAADEQRKRRGAARYRTCERDAQ